MNNKILYNEDAKSMIITSLRLRNFPEDKKDNFPWNLTLIQNFAEVLFEKQ